MSANGSSEPKSVEKNLQKENKALRAEIKLMELKIKTVQGDLSKSTAMKDRLEGLCRELQKQNRFIKAESSAKIAEANAKGKELAQEVQNNMGFMKNINQNLASITSESLEVKKENEDLAMKIATLKDHYEEREKILQSALNETNSALLLAKQDLGELRLKNAEEKEKLYGEMQQLANALVRSREQMKEAKETEITLRNLIQNYDEKFNGLQKALKDTNGAYDEFKSEMTKVTGRTKELEKETWKWQSRWEESNTALTLMQKNHQKLQVELIRSQESLNKMTNLCRALQTERKELLNELKIEEDKKINESGEVLKSTGMVDHLVSASESESHDNVNPVTSVEKQSEILDNGSNEVSTAPVEVDTQSFSDSISSLPNVTEENGTAVGKETDLINVLSSPTVEKAGESATVVGAELNSLSGECETTESGESIQKSVVEDSKRNTSPKKSNNKTAPNTATNTQKKNSQQKCQSSVSPKGATKHTKNKEPKLTHSSDNEVNEVDKSLIEEVLELNPPEEISVVTKSENLDEGLQSVVPESTPIKSEPLPLVAEVVLSQTATQVEMSQQTKPDDGPGSECVSPQPAQDVPKSKKKPQGVPKPTSGDKDDTAPKPNKKSKKHK